MNGSVRFIIISVLPQAVARRFEEVRREVCEIAHSKAALAYPPHLTLRTGVLVPMESLDTFLNEFSNTVGAVVPFPLTTDGLLFTEYRDGEVLKYLMGYRVRQDPELAKLNERLLGYERWRASNRLRFEPHLTLAFDDPSAEDMTRVRHWVEERPSALPAAFQWSCDNVSLYRRCGDSWSLHTEWRAGKPRFTIV